MGLPRVTKVDFLPCQEMGVGSERRYGPPCFCVHFFNYTPGEETRAHCRGVIAETESLQEVLLIITQGGNRMETSFPGGHQTEI